MGKIKKLKQLKAFRFSELSKKNGVYYYYFIQYYFVLIFSALVTLVVFGVILRGYVGTFGAINCFYHPYEIEKIEMWKDLVRQMIKELIEGGAVRIDHIEWPDSYYRKTEFSYVKRVWSVLPGDGKGIYCEVDVGTRAWLELEYTIIREEIYRKAAIGDPVALIKQEFFEQLDQLHDAMNRKMKINAITEYYEAMNLCKQERYFGIHIEHPSFSEYLKMKEEADERRDSELAGIFDIDSISENEDAIQFREDGSLVVSDDQMDLFYMSIFEDYEPLNKNLSPIDPSIPRNFRKCYEELDWYYYMLTDNGEKYKEVLKRMVECNECKINSNKLLAEKSNNFLFIDEMIRGCEDNNTLVGFDIKCPETYLDYLYKLKEKRDEPIPSCVSICDYNEFIPAKYRVGELEINKTGVTAGELKKTIPPSSYRLRINF
jgi:hypothetical protein